MKYRVALFSSAFCLVFVSVFFVGRFVWADQYGLEATASAADLVKETSVPTIIGNVIGAGLSLVTVLFFILMIYAGIKWMLARGDEGKAKEALDTIIAAIIGIVVVLAAYAITNFVFTSVGEQSGGGGGSSNSNGQDASVPGMVCVRNIDQDTDINNNINNSFCFTNGTTQSQCTALSFYGKNVCGWLQAGGCAKKQSIDAAGLDSICAALSQTDCEKPVGGTQYCKSFNSNGG